MNPKHPIAIASTLKAAGNPSEIIVYPNAQHGFNVGRMPGNACSRGLRNTEPPSQLHFPRKRKVRPAVTVTG